MTNSISASMMDFVNSLGGNELFGIWVFFALFLVITTLMLTQASILKARILKIADDELASSSAEPASTK